MTVNAGVRFDAFKSSFPAETYGPIQFAPTRNFTLPETPNSNWKDATPRIGVAYDLFGNGKTALKVSLNKYLIGSDGPAFTYGTQAPYSRVVHSTTRTWNDANRNFIPDCDLTSPLMNSECGPLADPNLGRPVVSTTYDPNAITGWGNRPFDWEFGASVQQQIFPRVSVEAGYFRRWYGNFAVTDNLAVTAADFDSYCIQAPVDGRLPDGGGNQICGLYNVAPTKFSVPAQNFVTLASNYGKQIEHWNGMDVSINARLGQGVLSNALAATPTTASAGALYGDRVNQLDLRIGKIFRFGRTRRTAVNLDVYNALNSSAVLTESTAYGTFRVPQIVMVGRFFKVSAQLDF